MHISKRLFYFESLERAAYWRGLTSNEILSFASYDCFMCLSPDSCSANAKPHSETSTPCSPLHAPTPPPLWQEKFSSPSFAVLTAAAQDGSQRTAAATWLPASAQDGGDRMAAGTGSPLPPFSASGPSRLGACPRHTPRSAPGPTRWWGRRRSPQVANYSCTSHLQPKGKEPHLGARCNGRSWGVLRNRRRLYPRERTSSPRLHGIARRGAGRRSPQARPCRTGVATENLRPPCLCRPIHPGATLGNPAGSRAPSQTAKREPGTAGWPQRSRAAHNSTCSAPPHPAGLGRPRQQRQQQRQPRRERQSAAPPAWQLFCPLACAAGEGGGGSPPRPPPPTRHSSSSAAASDSLASTSTSSNTAMDTNSLAKVKRSLPRKFWGH